MASKPNIEINSLEINSNFLLCLHSNHHSQVLLIATVSIIFLKSMRFFLLEHKMCMFRTIGARNMSYFCCLNIQLIHGRVKCIRLFLLDCVQKYPSLKPKTIEMTWILWCFMQSKSCVKRGREKQRGKMV